MPRSILLFLASLVPTMAALAQTAPPPSRPPIPPQVREVIIVSKTHFDIGYTDRIDAVLDQYRTKMMDTALASLEQSRALPPAQQFLWTLPGWPMTRILDQRQTAQRRAAIVAALKERRFAMHALAFTTHTESLDLEDMVRDLGFSSRIARANGLALPRAAKMTDVPSHSWVLPTLLRHAGVEFLHLGCNGGSSPPDVPVLFWWEGPDGSRLLTMYSKEYGTSLAPPPDWTHRAWLALIQTGDNHGPPTPAEVARLMDQARRDLPGITVRMGTMEDFADAILKDKTAAAIPVVRGDMPDTWIHGINSMPRETVLAHRARPALAAAEALNTLAHLWLGRPLEPGPIAVGYENSILYGEHTWGMNTGLFGPRVYGPEWQAQRAQGRYEKMEASWRDKGHFAEEASRLAHQTIARDLAALVGAVKVKGPRIVVFNPVPWRRAALVHLENAGGAGGGWKDAETGKLVSAAPSGGGIDLAAEDLPALGYRTFIPTGKSAFRTSRTTANGNTISNGLVSVTLDARTASIISIRDLRTNRELVPSNPAEGFARFVYERFSKQQVDAFTKSYTRHNRSWEVNDFGKPNLPAAAPYERILLENAHLEVSRDAAAARAVLRAAPDARLGGTIIETVTLPQGQPYVEIAWRIENKKADPWPESGWLALPVAMNRPAYRLLRLGGVMDPARDAVHGANLDLYCLNGGLAMLDASGGGVGILPVDSPFVSLGRPGSWRYTKAAGAPLPAVYWNLFNNQWSTNFQQWIEGTWTAAVRVWPIRDSAEAAALATRSIEGRGEAFAAASDGPAGTLALSREGLSVSRKGVQVTAFGPNPDGDGVIVRLWELGGVTGPVSVILPAEYRNAEIAPVDLRGSPLRDAAVRQTLSGFTANLRANAPLTVLIKPRTQAARTGSPPQHRAARVGKRSETD
jgi:alpha-mannosidase